MRKAICLLIKNENKYLNEWVRWHLTQDFNHFYIYNTGTEDPKEALKNFNPYLFTIIDWRNKYYFNMQIEAYSDCLKKAKQNQEEWLAFIDIDEFIYIPKNLLEETNEDISVIYLQQKLFNANGQLKYEDKPVQERFTQTCENIEHFVDKKVQLDLLKLEEWAYIIQWVYKVNLCLENFITTITIQNHLKNGKKKLNEEVVTLV